MAEILSGGLTWGSIQQAIVTMDKEGHPLTCCNPVTGECLGGGGDSDFSTAEVTIKCSINDVEIDGIFIHPVSDELATMNTTLPVNVSDLILKTPLYKGRNKITTNTEPTISGDATIEKDKLDIYIIITGDCVLDWHEQE